MDTLINNAANIIREASVGTLSLYVFCILVTAVLVVILFRAAPLPIQIGAFIATLLLMAVVFILTWPRPKPGPVVCETWQTAYFRISRDSDWRDRLEQQLASARPLPEHLFGTASSDKPKDADLQFWWCPDGTGPKWKVAEQNQKDWPHFFEREPRGRPIGFFVGPEGGWSLWYLIPRS